MTPADPRASDGTPGTRWYTPEQVFRVVHPWRGRVRSPLGAAIATAVAVMGGLVLLAVVVLLIVPAALIGALVWVALSAWHRVRGVVGARVGRESDGRRNVRVIASRRDGSG